MYKSNNKMCLFIFSFCLFFLGCHDSLKTQYTIGLVNKTGELLSDVEVEMLPEGRISGGLMNDVNTFKHMTPPWKIPECIIVTFINTKNVQHKFKANTNLSNDFYGDICIIINKNDDIYSVEIKTGKLGELN